MNLTITTIVEIHNYTKIKRNVEDIVNEIVFNNDTINYVFINIDNKEVTVNTEIVNFFRQSKLRKNRI